MSDRTKNATIETEAEPVGDAAKALEQAHGEQTVEQAVENLDRAKVIGIPLSEPETKIADSNRAEILESITAMDKSSKGATKAIFEVMRSCTTAVQADKILTRLEFDWQEANGDAPIPASWRTTKSAMLKLFRELPETIKEAKAALETVLTRDGVHDKAERDRRKSALFLDDESKLQPQAWGPNGYSGFKNAISALKKNAAKAKEPGKAKDSNGSDRPQEEYDTTGFAPEIIQARQRFLRAVKAASGNVPVPELVGLLNKLSADLEQRTAKAKERKVA